MEVMRVKSQIYYFQCEQTPIYIHFNSRLNLVVHRGRVSLLALSEVGKLSTQALHGRLRRHRPSFSDKISSIPCVRESEIRPAVLSFPRFSKR